MKYETSECGNCGRVMIANIPFIDKDVYGYEAAECPCGNGDGFFVGKMRDKQKDAELRDLLFGKATKE